MSVPTEQQETDRKKGRIKHSKSRNLLERLRNYEKETLRFMTDVDITFTNNQGVNDIRMTKLQQKYPLAFDLKKERAAFAVFVAIYRVAVKIMFRPPMRLPCFLRVDCLTLFLNWID